MEDPTPEAPCRGGPPSERAPDARGRERNGLLTHTAGCSWTPNLQRRKAWAEIAELTAEAEHRGPLGPLDAGEVPHALATSRRGLERSLSRGVHRCLRRRSARRQR